jgi:hypothetical protein
MSEPRADAAGRGRADGRAAAGAPGSRCGVITREVMA